MRNKIVCFLIAFLFSAISFAGFEGRHNSAVAIWATLETMNIIANAVKPAPQIVIQEAPVYQLTDEVIKTVTPDGVEIYNKQMLLGISYRVVAIPYADFVLKNNFYWTYSDSVWVQSRFPAIPRADVVVVQPQPVVIPPPTVRIRPVVPMFPPRHKHFDHRPLHHGPPPFPHAPFGRPRH